MDYCKKITQKYNKQKKKRQILCLLVVMMLFIAYLYWGNTTLKTTVIEIVDAEIPDGFHGFTIVHISDLHNTVFGENQKRLLQEIAMLSPDMIAVTGDLIDSFSPDSDAAMDFINGAMGIANVYYVTGNHEARIPEQYFQLKQYMQDAGVVVLESEGVRIQKCSGYRAGRMRQAA